MEELKAKVKSWQKALQSFNNLLKTDFEDLKNILSAQLVDGIKNGQIQKFEYCTERT